MDALMQIAVCGSVRMLYLCVIVSYIFIFAEH